MGVAEGLNYEQRGQKSIGIARPSSRCTVVKQAKGISVWRRCVRSCEDAPIIDVYKTHRIIVGFCFVKK